MATVPKKLTYAAALNMSVDQLITYIRCHNLSQLENVGEKWLPHKHGGYYMDGTNRPGKIDYIFAAMEQGPTVVAARPVVIEAPRPVPAPVPQVAPSTNVEMAPPPEKPVPPPPQVAPAPIVKPPQAPAPTVVVPAPQVAPSTEVAPPENLVFFPQVAPVPAAAPTVEPPRTETATAAPPLAPVVPTPAVPKPKRRRRPPTTQAAAAPIVQTRGAPPARALSPASVAFTKRLEEELPIAPREGPESDRELAEALDWEKLKRAPPL